MPANALVQVDIAAIPDGAADPTQALVLGAMHLHPFFLANPDLPALNLLPLAGVPVYLAIHVLTLWGLWARSRSAAPA